MGNPAGTQEASGVVVLAAESLADFLFCRRLRNRVRSLMTGDTEAISLLRQLKFYLRRPPGIELYIARVGGRRAGYLLLRHTAQTTLITEAVDDAFRRRGVGGALIRHAQQRCAELTADIRSDNAASLALHVAHGFERIGGGAGIETWRFRRSGPATP